MPSKEKPNDLEREIFKLHFGGLIHDFEVMSKLVKWCDSYTRYQITHFTFLKDFVPMEAYITRHEQMHYYITDVLFIVRKPNHRKPYDSNKIKEFKEFFLKKFKSANPCFIEVDENGKDK